MRKSQERFHNRETEERMMSTIESHDLQLVETGKNSTGTPVKKPQCVLDYNTAKKGVDFSDQMLSYYSVLRKGHK